MAKEIEMSFLVGEPRENVLKKFADFQRGRDSRILDIYLRHPNLRRLEPKGHEINESFRIRVKNGVAMLTWKRNHMDGDRYLYADEEEVEVGDFDTAYKLLVSLGFQELVRVSNLRSTFHTDAFEVVLDDVEGLGLLLEVECKASEVRDIRDAIGEIRAFVESLGVVIEEELNLGKPELLLRKRG